MPPSNTAPLRDPASSRTAEWPSRCQGEASWARASIANDEANTVAAKPSAARMGTMAIMGRLYRLAVSQTIELLVMNFLKWQEAWLTEAPPNIRMAVTRESAHGP